MWRSRILNPLKGIEGIRYDEDGDGVLEYHDIGEGLRWLENRCVVWADWTGRRFLSVGESRRPVNSS